MTFLGPQQNGFLACLQIVKKAIQGCIGGNLGETSGCRLVVAKFTTAGYGINF
jgi:hypothetical protein